ncbi:adenomatous polyposis coli protein-like [Hylaeus volcanicus]|uniref:adenomatous polyposis coli protein-like n=1 Tax=Hylaeus volcanicus TaxID=313075 RepID=UPI0023B7DBB2|nr:adenomatous polyposis coli protein-like [Hylaeus volcanicus]
MERSTGRRYEEEATEQPVDYIKKYVERKTVAQSHPIEGSPRADRSCKKEFGERDSKVDLFGDYAETDLDQPTDYSLRYAEDDTDDDEKQSPEYFSGSVQEDTVKTYCTEGTPYETPFNFSTATSMSDLRLEDAKEPIDSQKKLNKKALDLGRKEDLTFERTLPLNCNEGRSHLVEKELETMKTSQACKPGRLSPEKLLDYYQPGTSNGFSRANSLSSLGSAITQRNNGSEIPKVSPTDSTDKIDSRSERVDHNVTSPNVNGLRISTETDNSTEGKNNTRVVDKEGKMVTFSRQDYYAEQTPLMFSRCSSLGSLSGFEQHSIHDDRSSVISDFSRRTSGVVSPSELPDSPTQTTPPSPRNHKSQCTDFISKIPEEAVRPSVRHLSYSKCHAPRTSVFEDDIATFKEESTPIEFSTATSLSSLTIDDELKITNGSKMQSEVKDSSNNLDKNIKVESSEEKVNNAETEKDQEQVSDGDEDDEDMLAACISMGIQNNRYRQSFKTSNVQKSIQPESSNMLRCQRPVVLNQLELRVPVANIDTSVTASKTNKSAIEVVSAPDTMHVYCTEDTPADISPVGSQSNLSALSMPSVQEGVERIEKDKSSSEVESHRNDLSDESSNLSGEDEKILDACIQSGIPKVRQITPPPTSCISFAQKADVSTQIFNKCGTPSSSPVESRNKNPIHGKSLCRATLEHDNDLSDESPNHSDDEAVLNECIRSAMPKVRLNISTLMGQTLPQTVDKLKTATIRKLSSSVSYSQSEYAEQNKQKSKKPVAFDDNLSLSEEEEDIMLAQCIKSGMPKALNGSSNSSLVNTKKQSEQYSKTKAATSTSSSYFNKSGSSRNATVQIQSTHRSVQNGSSVFMHGGTSCILHSAKALENRRLLVKNGGINGCERVNPSALCNRKYSQTEQDHGSVNENSSTPLRSRVPNCRSPISNGTDNDDDEPCRNSVKSNVAPSRHSSVSSLSEEGSLGSIEEWALLELCISSGMPRNKYRLKTIKGSEGSNHEERDTIAEDNYSICSYNSYVCKT